MKVVILPEVEGYLENLGRILYEYEYFGFEEDAIKYVEELVFEIKKQLPIRQRKPAPAYFDKYGKGMYYAAFKKNKRTSWYAFFRIYEINGDRIYQVRYIANNHTVAQYL